MRVRRRSASRIEIWTCPVCGTRADGSGKEGLWPPDGWQLAEADSLLARCPAHRVEEPPVRSSDLRGEVRHWFGPTGL